MAGAEVDCESFGCLMEIREMGNDMVHAGVRIADYTDEFKSIFAQLGGGHPVVLIE